MNNLILIALVLILLLVIGFIFITLFFKPKEELLPYIKNIFNDIERKRAFFNFKRMYP